MEQWDEVGDKVYPTGGVARVPFTRLRLSPGLRERRESRETKGVVKERGSPRRDDGHVIVEGKRDEG